MDKSLFTIQSEYVQELALLEQWFYDNPDTDEVPEEFLERLSVNRDEVNDKLRNYYLVIEQLKAQESVLKLEMKRLQQLAKRKAANIAYLKQRITDAVLMYGNETKGTNDSIKPNLKLETPLLNVTYIRQFPTVITDEKQVPDDYKTYRIEVDFTNLPEHTAEYICDVLNRTKAFGDIFEPTAVIDDKRVNTALKANVIVPGAELDTEKGYIRLS
jgi:hypothetical protein